MVSVEITIVTTEADPYARYHGKTVDESLDPSFWDTQPEAQFTIAGAGFTHTQTVNLIEGSHYIIYGNSAASSYPWHAQIFINGTLVAEGDVYRGSQLRGNFTVTEVEPTGVTINAIVSPAKAGFLVWLQWLSPTGWMYLESGTTDAAGKKTWLYYFTSYPQTVRIHLPAGQVIDGVEYGEYTSEQVTLYDTQEGDLYLYPEAVEPEPSVGYIVISAPSSAEAGVTFEILGYVLDQYGNPMAGVPVYLFDNGSHFATTTTGSNGYYFQDTSISLAGVHELAANAGTKWAYRDITITEPVGEPYTQITDFIIPESLPAGAPIGELTVVTKNAGTATGYLAAYINSERYTEVAESSYPTEVAVGGTFTFHLTLQITSNMPNEDLPLTALNDDGTSYITKTITLAPEVVDGRIIVVYYWIEGMAGWAYLNVYPTPAKVGDEIHLAVGWVNDGPAPVVGNIYAQLQDQTFYRVYIPDAVANQDRSADPHHGWIVQFTPVTLNVSGSWEFFGMLTLDGEQFIDWKKYTFEVQEVPVGIPTTTTITIPDKVGVDEKFNISGILYETEASIPIPNQPINHSYDGRNLGTSITGVDGDYLKEVSVPESGVWTLKSEFPGTEALQASRSKADAIVAASPLEAAIAIIGSVATGLALFIYGTS